MEVNGKIFTKPLITEIRRIIAKEPEISRCELSRRVCKIMDWYSANGKSQDMSCRKALLTLARKKAIELPMQKQSYSFQKKRAHTLDYKIAEFKGELCDFGTIIIEDITSRYSKDSKIWFDLLDQYHYLGSGTLCGSQIRYIVKSSEHGYIGALAFSSATYKSKARDDYIGWSEGARRENIKFLISNDRFLIIPTVKVANLASHIMSEVLSRLPSDWEKRYAVRPLLIESYVDPSRFTGSSYKASNWVEIGYTSGRRDGVAKKIFIYKLNRNWRKHLCHETVAELGSMEAIEDASHWAEQEFGRVRFYDNRLKERLYTIAQDFYNDPEAGIPQACGNRARSIGAYRFFQNKKVTMDVLLDSHTEATIDRIKEHNVVLAPQDTTTLNYSAHPLTEGLGPVNKVDDNNIGLLLHDTLAFTEDGTPLGVIDAQCWARDPEDKGKSQRRKELPIEQKESMKWLRSFQKLSEIQKLCPETMLVSIGDREADIYELFHEALSNSQVPKLLVRSERTRKRKVEQEELWDFMSRQNIAGTIKIHIPRRSIKKAREALLDIRFAEVALTPPKRYSTNEPLKIWAVYLLEQSEEMPIEWMLLTTAAVNTFEDAQKIVEWYSGRWGIEVYHRVLKSGCRIKDRQLGNAEHIETSLGIDMVVAWRIYHMTMLGRETPNSPCTVFFKDVEWKALYSYVNKTPLAPQETPTLQEAIMMLGQIGGHLGRKSDGPPGTQTLWRGLQRLDTATEMYVIFTDKSPPATI
jgi:hypothetical protein